MSYRIKKNNLIAGFIVVSFWITSVGPVMANEPWVKWLVPYITSGGPVVTVDFSYLLKQRCSLKGFWFGVDRLEVWEDENVVAESGAPGTTKSAPKKIGYTDSRKLEDCRRNNIDELSFREARSGITVGGAGTRCVRFITVKLLFRDDTMSGTNKFDNPYYKDGNEECIIDE